MEPVAKRMLLELPQGYLSPHWPHDGNFDDIAKLPFTNIQIFSLPRHVIDILAAAMALPYQLRSIS